MPSIGSNNKLFSLEADSSDKLVELIKAFPFTCQIKFIVYDSGKEKHVAYLESDREIRKIKK